MGATRAKTPYLTNAQHNDIVVLMIPEFIDIGAAWKVLPPGVHDASLEEVRERFATNETRARLFDGFIKACQSLASAGCKVLYLDGSYVTEKRNPEDYDVCWDYPAAWMNAKWIRSFSIFRTRESIKRGNIVENFFPQVSWPMVL